jgi:hypothetical protein
MVIDLNIYTTLDTTLVNTDLTLLIILFLRLLFYDNFTPTAFKERQFTYCVPMPYLMMADVDS